MSLLLYGEIRSGFDLPDFGEDFRQHMQNKRNPDVYAASLSAWRLLEKALRLHGISSLPKVGFTENGKPVFADSDLHFSLSHSASMAAVILSHAPCGIDIEIIRPETAKKLCNRVLSAREKESNRDFFEAWTMKEAIGKLTGAGMPAKPCEMEISDFVHLNRQNLIICDTDHREYFLSAVCKNVQEIKITDCF